MSGQGANSRGPRPPPKPGSASNNNREYWSNKPRPAALTVCLLRAVVVRAEPGIPGVGARKQVLLAARMMGEDSKEAVRDIVSLIDPLTSFFSPLAAGAAA